MPTRIPLPPGAAQMYQSGASLKAVAEAHGLTVQTLTRRLREQGVELRRYTEGNRKGHPRRFSDQQLLELADGTRSAEEIAALLGVGPEAARRRMVKLGIPRLPAKARPDHNTFWKGGRTVDKHGYVLVKAPEHPYRTAGGYVREHRLVMEAALGRYLEPTEVVHHRDGDTSNNDPANLELHRSNGAHLAATLKGRAPNWTEDGRQRIAQGVRRAAAQRRATPAESTDGGGQ